MLPIKTALCSFGVSGWVFHAPFIHLHNGFTFYAVWERSKQLAKQKYPDVIVYTSYEDMLADKEIELVVVNTPNATHFDYAKKALLAGKHVIVEKSFTITTEEAKQLIELAAQEKKVLSVFQNRRYDSDFLTVKKVVDEKLLGNIAEAEIHYDRFRELLSPKLHKEVPGPGAGILYDLGPHLIDQALQLFGMPDAVFADLSIIRPISKVIDYMEVLLFYPNLRVRIKANFLVREILPAYILNGSKGSFIKSRADVQEDRLMASVSPNTPDWGLEPVTEEGLLHTEKDGKIIREHIPTQKGNYSKYYDGIYEAIRNNKLLPVTAADALKVIRIIEAAYKSNDEKIVVDFKI